LCVAITIFVPAASNARMTSRSRGSKPDRGSPSARRKHFGVQRLASATRCCSPPDSTAPGTRQVAQTDAVERIERCGSRSSRGTGKPERVFDVRERGAAQQHRPLEFIACSAPPDLLPDHPIRPSGGRKQPVQQAHQHALPAPFAPRMMLLGPASISSETRSMISRPPATKLKSSTCSGSNPFIHTSAARLP
jgi:hypothetical protein